MFDLDGTLVDCFELHFKAAQEVMKDEFGLEFPREHLTKYYGTSTQRIASKFFESQGVFMADEDIEDYVKKRRERLLELIKEGGVLLLPGALRLLSELKERLVKLALATSNSSDTTAAILESAGVKEFFEVVVTRSDVKKGKPEPDFFLTACKRLGILPQECAVVEDSLYGVMSAKKAGAKVVGVTTGFHNDENLEPYCDLVVHALNDLDFDVLSGLFEGGPAVKAQA